MSKKELKKLESFVKKISAEKDRLIKLQGELEDLIYTVKEAADNLDEAEYSLNTVIDVLSEVG